MSQPASQQTSKALCECAPNSLSFEFYFPLLFLQLFLHSSILLQYFFFFFIGATDHLSAFTKSPRPHLEKRTCMQSTRLLFPVCNCQSRQQRHLSRNQWSSPFSAAAAAAVVLTSEWSTTSDRVRSSNECVCVCCERLNTKTWPSRTNLYRRRRQLSDVSDQMVPFIQIMLLK